MPHPPIFLVEKTVEVLHATQMAAQAKVAPQEERDGICREVEP